MARIAADRALVDSFGQAGRRFAETFTWDRAARETLAHLEEIVTRAG
jgi:glycosyltransferase involved in cell wall biosynthesis